ncbi:Xanthan lyase precursor [Maioricimonas rarisocia]|uniref:Xanthan lyase n=1 Tax=Maioricimonas rarisocia TaxID=2528026 RepID=A0A517ZG20_9PLAN|nr:FAD-dependent oxidoreductase [Maioricimonas rarisocia]QDU41433.1 Xanthan lyase precursor [Maioricimonas rarisocia]
MSDFTRQAIAALLVLCGSLTSLRADEYDVVIYGGTSAGAAAAIQTSRMGKSVVLIEPKQHIGGLTISGLGWTDSGNKAVIGGISREFYQRIKKHYDNEETWVHEDRAGYGRYRPTDDAMWTFEPHVAENLYLEMLDEADVEVVLGERLDREDGVVVKDGRIESITTVSGKTYSGERFIDATYEGDLMAAAGVSYTVGRESNSVYGETLNGVQIARARSHQFIRPVDPYVKPGDPSSGLLPGINTNQGKDGQGDHRVQAYNYRLCITDVRDNQIPFARPEGYEPEQYELLLRNFEAGDSRLPLKIDMMPNRKTDVNNNHAVSTDFIGMNYDYPEADDETREEILRKHETYVRGLMWTLATHERVPDAIRKEVSRWGWAQDEWTDNNHWPYWCYIREARRMISDYVQTEHDCKRDRLCEDPVGLGSYNMDSHNCQRYVDENGHVRNEGDVQVSPGGPYLISYRSIVPKQSECSNLFVPVCLSASHIAYGSIRMEPVFMILGQSAATAACLSIDKDCAVQELDYAVLEERLSKDGQVLAIPEGSVRPKGLNPKKLDGIVVDDTAAKKIGGWRSSGSVSGFVADSYLHDNNELQGETRIEYPLPISQSGNYEVRVSYTPNPNRASNVRVVVRHAKGETEVTLNQRKKPGIDGVFEKLGEFEFRGDGTGMVTISNDGADGHVIADAVQLIAK